MKNLLEDMDHEFPNFSQSLSTKGYRVDGDKDGVRYLCNLSNLKAIDYFFIPEPGKLVFVEFSDLASYYKTEVVTKKKQLTELIRLIKDQDTKLNEEDRVLKGEHRKQFDRLRRFFVKTVDQQVFFEFSEKFKDTFFLKEVLFSNQLLRNIPPEIKSGPVDSYLVVFPPIDHLEDHEKQEIRRFLDRLSASISNSVSSYHLLNKVNLVSITDLLS